MIRNRKKPRTGLIAALDVGSTKIACFIVKADANGPRVGGIGHQVARGVRCGAIVSLDDAEASILNAVSAAEQMAGESLESVMVNIAGGAPDSRTVSVEAEPNPPRIPVLLVELPGVTMSRLLPSALI